MKIRVATKADHEAIMKIAKQSKCTRDFGSHMFSSDASYEKGWIVVAVDDLLGVLLGFYCVRHKVREPVTSLYFIGVENKLHSSGVGQKLMQDLYEKCRPTIRLNCLKDNLQATRFYERLGFKIVGEGLGGSANVFELAVSKN